jgi:Tol biopolymer transport system component
MVLMRLSDIVARGRLDSPAAVGLALAISAQLRDDALAPPRRPSRDDVVLKPDGEVALVACDLPIEVGGEARWLAGLVYDLLGLDSGDRACREPVPGALMLLLARALGQTPLPPTSYPQFLDGLNRFGTPDRQSLAALHARIAAPDPVPAAAARVESLPLVAGLPQPGALPEPVYEWQVEAPPPSPFDDTPRVDPPLFGAWPVSAYERRPSRVSFLAAAAAACLIAVGALAFSSAWRSGAEDQAPAATVSGTPAGVRGTAGAQTSVNETDGTSGPAAANLAQESNDRVRPRAAATTDPPAAAPTPADQSPSIVASGAGLAQAGASSPTFAADGRELFFSGGRDSETLMRASLDPAGSVVDVAPALEASTPRHHVSRSPDGRWIAYDVERNGVSAVYVAQRDGTAPRQVSGAGHAAIPTWSPDGQRLVFLKADADRTRVWNLWVVDMRRGALQRLTSHSVGQPKGAAWFPGGDRIVYGVDDTLVIVDVHGGGSTRIKSPVAGRLVRTPAVSPDGTRIVFQVFRDGAWMYDLTSGESRRILDDSSAEAFAWSPDGQRLVYHSFANGRWSVYQTSLREDGAAAAAAPIVQ